MKIERMPETKTAPERESDVVVANNLEEYVRELSQRMILPKGKIEGFRGVLASPDQLAPLVERTEDTRIELKVTTPSQTRFSISSDIKALKNKEKLKVASRSVQLASLAEAEARFRVVKNSEHIPDQVRYAGFNLDRTIAKLHKQAEKLVKGEKVFGKTKAEKKMGILALSLTAAACGKISTPIQPTSVEPVATEVTSLPTETQEPTPTSTEEPTPEAPKIQYKEEEGNILQWRDGGWQETTLPEGTREIGMVEKHKGNWYGIDTYDRAVVKLNEQGEWEEYTRPIVVSTYDSLPIDTITDIAEADTSPAEEVRFVDSENNLVPFGYLYTKEVSSTEFAYFSGIVRGGFQLENAGGQLYQHYVVEIPLRYERQIVTFTDVISGGITRRGYIIPESGNIDEAEMTGFGSKALRQIFASPNANRTQMIWASDMNQRTPNEEAYQAALRELITALQNGQTTNMRSSLYFNQIWASASLISSP
jgi:hypothetical protein